MLQFGNVGLQSLFSQCNSFVLLLSLLLQQRFLSLQFIRCLDHLLYIVDINPNAVYAIRRGRHLRIEGGVIKYGILIEHFPDIAFPSRLVQGKPFYQRPLLSAQHIVEPGYVGRNKFDVILDVGNLPITYCLQIFALYGHIAGDAVYLLLFFSRRFQQI